MKKLLFLSTILVLPLLAQAQFGDYPFSRTQLGVQTTKNQYLLVPTSGVPAWTPVADTNAIFAIDTTNAILYGYFGAAWDTVATSAAVIAESDPVWLADSTDYARKTYADQAEADAKAYADANDDDTQLTPAQVVGISRDSSFLEQLSALGVIEEEGQSPETFNQSDTLHFNLSYTASPDNSSLWDLNGDDAQYGAGDVRVSNNLFVDGNGYEYLSSPREVVKLVPTEIDVETLTWGSAGFFDYGFTHPDFPFNIGDFPAYQGDTINPDTVFWYLLEQDFLSADSGWYKFYVDYDTLTFDMTQDPDAVTYLNAWLGPGPYEGDVKSIWFDAVYNPNDPFSQPALSWPENYNPTWSTYLYIDTLKTDSIQFYNRIPIDSTAAGAFAVINQLDTTTYSPGYLDFMTRYQVDSMIAASILGDATLLDVEELYVNPIFLGFGSLDELSAGIANMGMFGPLAVAQMQMLAFGTEAYVTVRSTTSRPVNFRAVDEDLDRGVELRVENNAGTIAVYDSSGNVTTEIKGSDRAKINGSFIRNDRWGIGATNATIADTLRAEIISVGPTTINSVSGVGTHTSNATINSTGEFAVTSVAPDQLNLPADSTMDTYNLTQLQKRVQLESDGNYSERFVTAVGATELALNSDKHSIFTEGVAVIPDPTDTIYALLHVKEDIQDQALQYTFPVTPGFILENFEDFATINLLSDEGGAINFASDQQQSEAQFNFDLSTQQFNWLYDTTTILSVDASANVAIGRHEAEEPLSIYDNEPSILLRDMNAPDSTSRIRIDGNGGVFTFRYVNTSGAGSDFVAFDRNGTNDLTGMTFWDFITPTVHLDNSGASYFNGGNVGIGTSTPSELFTVNDGNLLIKRTGAGNRATLSLSHGDATGDFNIQQDAVGNAIFDNLAGANLHYVGTGIHQFNVGGSEIARIDNAGVDIQNGNLVLQNDGTATNPLVRIYSETGVSADYFDIQDVNDTGVRLDKHNDSGTTIIDISAIPGDGTSNGLIRFGRYTNSTGSSSVAILKGDGTAAQQTLLGMGGVNSYINAIDGNVGIGTTSPDTKLHIGGNNAFRIGDSGDYFQIEDQTDRAVIEKVNNSGSPYIDINVKPLNGTGNASVRFFRETNTTGTVGIEIKKGDGTNTNQHILRGNKNSAFAIDNSNIGIGTASPTEKFHVVGNSLFDGIVYGDYGRGLVYWEDNANDNNDGGAGVTLRTSVNPGSGAAAGSIFAVRSSGQAARLWVGQSLTSTGVNNFAVGMPTNGSEANAGSYSIFMDASEGSIKADYFNFAPQSSAPTGTEGNIYYDSTDDELKYHDGSGYQSVGGGAQTTYTFVYMGGVDASEDEDYLPTNASNMIPTTVGQGSLAYYNYDGTDITIWVKNVNGFGNYSGSNFQIELLEDTDNNPSGSTIVQTWDIDDLDDRANERFQGTATLTADRFYFLKIESSGMSSNDDFVYGFEITK